MKDQKQIISDRLLKEGCKDFKFFVRGASIREIVEFANKFQDKGKLIRLELGNPGLRAAIIGVVAQIFALMRGVAAKYPPIDGIPKLKKQASRFIKNFLNLNITPAYCIPTVGSMQGILAAMMLLRRIDKNKKKFLFIDPGFPVNKLQEKILEVPFESFDIGRYRGDNGDKLREKLEKLLSSGEFHSLLYSNPNNPAWVCLTPQELQIIGELANKYDVIVMEDLAYFGMDFREDYSHPGRAPYQPTVGDYTNNYILMISSSKAFSYAGERCAIVAISNKLASRNYPDLESYCGEVNFVKAFIYKILAPLSSGTSHSAQHALAAILAAANKGLYNFRKHVIVYGRKARKMKTAFLSNGFYLVYDKDGEKPLADGMYFTVGYPNMDEEELFYELLKFGIVTVPLKGCGSVSDGVRICTSLIKKRDIPLLAERLMAFARKNPINGFQFQSYRKLRILRGFQRFKKISIERFINFITS